MKDIIYVLDAYGLIYRSYFAFVSRPLTNSKGENVSAIFGFFKSLHSIFAEYNPKLFVTALDSVTPTFRHEMYKEYKATRDKTPDDLHAQIDKIEEILKTFKLPTVRFNGFEADDVIASIAALAEKEDRECVIISGDKDLMQLVSKTTTMLKPGKIKAWEGFDAENVKEEWGVYPAGMLDLLSLIGDSADNVPGIKGVGPKTAVKLLEEYKTLDGIYSNTKNLKGALKTKIEEGKESAYFSKELIRLRFDVPVEKDLNAYSTSQMDYEAAARLFISEELPNIAKLYSEKIIAEKALSKHEKNETSSKENLKQETGLFENSEQTSPEMLPQELGTGEEISLPQNKGDYKLVDEAEELFKIVDEALKQGLAAYDCETTSEDPLNAEVCGFSIALKEGVAYYFPLKAPCPELGEEAPKLIAFKDAKKAVTKLFDSKMTLIMHNGKFDIQAALSSKLANCISANLFDTMVAAWLLDPTRSSYGMDKLAESILNVKTIRFKEVVKDRQNFSDVPLKEACPYAAEDADITFRFYKKFLPLLKKNNLEKLFFDLEMPITKLLTEMEIKGIFLKGEELTAYSKELGIELEECEKDIYRLVGHEFNIASPKQLQEVLFEERKLPTSKKTKTGYSTDTSVLENLASEDPVPAKILDYRALAKLKSTYTDTLPKMTDKNGRIHTSFIQTGTATGRLSSRDPNLQNIPIRGNEGRKIREAFQAEKGRVLISADYSQIELVILAHLSKDQNLVEAFNKGIDVHAKTASLIFAVDIKDVTQDMRRIAKTINFGVMYGMSAFRLASSLRIPRKRADEFIKAYFATYSGVSGFMAKVCQEAEQRGYVETIMGRRRYLPAINSKNKVEKAGAERIAVNTPIQGTAADIVKLAMLEVDKALKKQKLDASILLQVHDELIIEAAETEREKVMSLVKEKMEGVIKLSVPLRVSIESGMSWGEFH
ncbi:DNA polymerase I [Treponema putidum]|uniref:DNA polymerase I n=1 Tax=Treponema putidum TaxID=221027 RepID=A0AAE9SHY1_9SPIR|nr:DNA polymerase I [Treponema putidum]UTY33525.1 DNA polymerase I [Treponema putidum]